MLSRRIKDIFTKLNNSYPKMLKFIPGELWFENLGELVNWDGDSSYVSSKSGLEAMEHFQNNISMFMKKGKGNVVVDGIEYSKAGGDGGKDIPDFPSDPEEQMEYMLMAGNLSFLLGQYTSYEDILEGMPEGKLAMRDIKREYELADGSTQKKTYKACRCSLKGEKRIHISTKDMGEISTIYMMRDMFGAMARALRPVIEEYIDIFCRIFSTEADAEDIINDTVELMHGADTENYARNAEICESEMRGRGGGSESENVLVGNAKSFVTGEIERRREYRIGEEYPIQWYGRACRGVTSGGNYISSKNEAIFANIIERYKIPYACEVELNANRANSEPYTADFFYYSVIGRRRIYVEILGAIGDRVYSDRAYNKISNYYKAGVRMGENLVVFVCGHNSLINTSLMHKVFLMSLAGYLPTGPVII